MKKRCFQSADGPSISCPASFCELRGSTCRTAQAIICPRRTTLASKSELRFNCDTCGLKRMCYECMKLCHTKHRVFQVRFKPEHSSSSFCECGIQVKGCRLLPIISEAMEFTPTERIKVTVIQRAVRAFIARCVMKKLIERRKRIRYLVCANYWMTHVLEPIWVRVKTGVSKHHEALERHNMGIEEDNRRKYDYYLSQQKAILRMNAMLRAVRHWLGVSSVHINSGVRKFEERPTYAFSCHSIRYQQNLLHFSRRLKPSEIVKPLEYMPVHHVQESVYFDPDTRLLYGRFMRDIPTLKWLKRVEDWKLSRYEAKVLAAREASAMRRKARAMKARVMKEAKELQLREEAGEDSNIDANSVSEEVQIPQNLKLYLDDVARHRKDKSQRLLREAEVEEADDRPFDALRTMALPIRRRHSITDPCNMYARLQRLRPDFSLKSFSKRRLSLPPDIRALRLPEGPQRRSAYEDVLRSLDLFAARNGQLLEFVDPKYIFVWEKIPPAARKRRMLRLIRLSWLNPRLPREVRDWIREDKAPRRRTIADPERLAKQLQLMFLIRNNLGKLRHMALFEENSLIRRRSFDFGEIRDHEDNMLAPLGYQLELPIVHKTIDELLSDSEEMNQRMSNMWLPNHLEEEDRAMAAYLPTNYQQQVIFRSKSAHASKYWKEYFDPDTNLPFYYCEELGQSSWEPPVGANDVVLYRMFDVETGAWFYYNHATEESIWASLRPQL